MFCFQSIIRGPKAKLNQFLFIQKGHISFPQYLLKTLLGIPAFCVLFPFDSFRRRRLHVVSKAENKEIVNIGRNPKLHLFKWRIFCRFKPLFEIDCILKNSFAQEITVILGVFVALFINLLQTVLNPHLIREQCHNLEC